MRSVDIKVLLLTLCLQKDFCFYYRSDTELRCTISATRSCDENFAPAVFQTLRYGTSTAS